MKQIKNFETKNAEAICLELVIAKKKWYILFAYRPPDTNKTMFFNEIYITLNKILGKCDNLAGNLKLDELKTGSDSSNHLPDAKDVVNLTNLFKKPTCFKSQDGTLIDLMLTNRPRCFFLSDCHKLVVSILRISFKKLPRKIITYRHLKRFKQDHFLRDLDRRLLQGELYRNCDEPYKKLTEIFNDILNHHTPLKQKQVRGNHGLFMTKDLSKAIMNKSKAKNKYLNRPSRENFISYKRTKNKCNSLTKKPKRDFFKEATKDGSMPSKKFWCIVKPFLTNNGCISNNFISIENEGNPICNEQELVELFNEHYINIVEKSSDKKPLSLRNSSDASQDEMTVK